ncbi:flavin-containing monooxygenase [Chachezhania antarctica]|uniref:flavin-containing monooxygenase n=1 Tax=Chachezhania antarctica TaxID=2340860 RepID=UPI000EB19312|nr:NAD(P)/FAD-dependent oxidoreductase [Chachezhania antarctica]
MRTIVIGAGPAGLAVAACLKQDGADVAVLERETCVGSSWHRHYDRLHLHSPKWLSYLPGRPMPKDWPRYPSRGQVVEYLEDYAQANGLALLFGVEVTGVAEDGAGWSVTHSGGVERGDVVVFATGLSQRPFLPEWPGQDGFPGPVIHSSEYRNPAPFKGKRMLVVGFGNSGGEIALDLAEAGMPVDIAVRSPVNLLPKELFGRPIQSMGVLQKIFPPRVADAITAPVLRWALGDYTAYGLRRPAKGPVTQIREDGRVPLIDIGTLGAIKAGRITVRPGLEAFEGSIVRFVDGTTGTYDAIVLATGYRVDLRPMLGQARDVLDDRGRPKVCGGPSARKGLYFCAYAASTMGQLGQIRMEAPAIAEDVRQRAAG